MSAGANPSAESVLLPAGGVRAVIVDDEPAARRGIRLLLDRDSGVRVVGEASSGEEAIALIRRERPDLAFLDIQMPGLDGFEVLSELQPGEMPAIVFVTAYNEHAVRAFEVNAVDYLLKPFDDERFAAALERAKAGVRNRRSPAGQPQLHSLLDYLQSGKAAQAGAPERILLKSAGEIYFLKPDEIDWIEAEGDYMKFHVGDKSHLLRETMARLEQRLDRARFVRVHRSTIVNIDRVRKITPSFVGEYVLTLQDGTKLKLSRGYHARIAALLKSAL